MPTPVSLTLTIMAWSSAAMTDRVTPAPNATFAANVAQGGQGALNDGGNAAGGGLYLQNGGLGTTRLVNDTIALNKAFGGQGSGALAISGVGSGASQCINLPIGNLV